MNVEDIIKLIYADKQLKALKKKIEEGFGTFVDTAAYCNRSAELLGRYLSESVLAMSDIERIAANDALLRDRYKDINELLDKVQRTVDKAQGLNIRPQHAPYNKERADQIGQALTDKTVPDETIQRRAKSAPANMTRSMQDDFIEENVEFRSKAGLKCYIVRISDGEPCEWCDKLAGRYEYGSEPEDVYRRHDNCGCTVTYENGRQRQNVWTKKIDSPDYDKEYLKERDKIKAGKNKPLNRSQQRSLQEHMDIFSREQAQRLDAEKAEKNTKSITAEERKELLSQNKVDIYNSTVDNSAKSGIIKAITIDDFNETDSKNVISKECKETIINTLKEQGVSYIYDEIKIVNIPRSADGKIEPLRTNAISSPSYPKIVLEVNETAFGGRSKEQIDLMFKAQDYSVANSLEEAVVHESAHAKVIQDKTYANYEAINEELSSDRFKAPIKDRDDKKSLKDLAGGISKYAQKDGLECIAETHVKLRRGENVPKELKVLHDEYIQ